MSDFFQSIMAMPAPFNMVVLIVLIGSVAGVMTAISNEMRKYFCHREELELKREMLERGLDAQEIEQIVHATAAGKQPDKLRGDAC